MRWLSQDDAGIGQVGDLKDFNGGEIRGFRFGAVGTINFDTPWTYTLFIATNAFDKGFDSKDTDDLTLFDYRVDIPVFDGMNLSIGKQKEPISMDRLMVGTHIQMQERAAVLDAMLPSRNFGALLSGTAAKERMTWAAGVFNNWIDSGDSFGESSSQVVGRVTWLPFISEDESNLVHLGFGVRHTNAKEGIHFHTEPEFNLSSEFVDTMNFAADSAMTYNLEATWRKGPFWLSGELLTTDVSSPTFGDPSFSGYHITGSWVLTGEMRPYKRRNGVMGNVPISKSVQQDGWGSLELALRWSELDLTDGLIDGGELDVLSLGVNWSLTSTFVLSVNYRHISTDRAGVAWDSSGVNTRLILMLE
jgi:phosphate-selective porin OprO/OprP